MLLAVAAFPPYHQFDGQLSAISYMLVIYELLPEVFVLIRMMFLAALVGMSFIKSGDGECHERLI